MLRVGDWEGGMVGPQGFLEEKEIRERRQVEARERKPSKKCYSVSQESQEGALCKGRKGRASPPGRSLMG